MARLADIYVVGIGIRGLDQISQEALWALRSCRKIFHQTDQHQQLAKINPHVIDLAPLYWTNEEQIEVYERLADLIGREVENGPGVASVIYGHPLFFDDIHADLLRRSKRRGWRCEVLPGISSLDTLSIDLNIDYGEGLQVHEASDLVERKQTLNPRIHTLIFQIAEFNSYLTCDTPSTEVGRFRPMERYLKKFFPADHPIIIAFSDDGDGTGTFLLKSRINKLDSLRRKIFLGTTLYIPPID
jgi:uncharacterized protein YabN with tetrapyrrole methylase and pyrophosphatase domain